MDYNRILGTFVSEPIQEWEVSGKPTSGRLIREHEFMRPRLGIPEGMIKWETNKADIEKILCLTRKHGSIRIPVDINQELRQHVQHFRNCLDAYDIIVRNKVFSIDEIFERCLSEGPAYTKFISKSRQQSLQAMIALDTITTKDCYVHEEYTGYDSIFHERYLIYWDDTEDVGDWVYSLFPHENEGEIEFRRIARRLVQKWRWSDMKGDTSVPMIADIAGKVTSKNTSDGKTTALKNSWFPCADGGRDWIASRRVVPASGRKTRDTGVPDVPTLCRLKMIHQAVRRISSNCNYSANCDGPTLTKRCERIKNKRRFLHLDFKKFGLTYLRCHPNSLLDLIGLSETKVDNFYLITDRGTVETDRGTVLGWLDPLVALVSIIILHDLKEKYKWEDMDFIVFNDDIEIGFSTTDESELQLRRGIIIDRFESFGFIMSHRKIFISKMFIFLENYEYPGDLDMSKKQLIVNQFANSLSTPYTWEAKSNFADGWRFCKDWRLKEICQGSIKNIFGQIEYDLPVELGGWTHFFSGSLNVGLLEATPNQLAFYFKMSKWKRPTITEKYEYVSYEMLEASKRKTIEDSIKGSVIDRGDLEFDEKNLLSADDKHRLNITREGTAVDPRYEPLLSEDSGTPKDPNG